MENLNEKLVSAAHDGKTDEVVSCLQRGADINCKDSDGVTALHLAAEEGHDRSVEVLVEGGGDINVQDRLQGMTALHKAARGGRDRSVEILVEGGGDINVQDVEGKTALHWAAREGYDRSVEILVEGGGDINVQDNEGKTALHWAALGGHGRIVGILVEGGGDINVQDIVGKTALHLAAEEGHDRSVEILVEGGGEVNVQDDEGWTALHRAALMGHDRIVEVLVEGGGDINVQDDKGTTALHLAARGGHDRIVEVLVEGGGEVNVQDGEGSTPLHMAVIKESWHDIDDMKSKEKTAAVLVQSGSDMSLKDEEGKTPLDYCTEDLKSSLEALASQIQEIKAAFPSIAGTKEFRILLLRGTYKSYNNRVYLAGACNVGKSTLASNLIGENILLTWNSTDGLVIYFGRNGIDLEKKEMVPLKIGPQDNSILASVLRGQPTMEELVRSADIETSKESSSLQKSFQDMTMTSDTQESDSAHPSSNVKSPSEPPPLKQMTQTPVRRKERKKKECPPPLVSKKENTNVHQSIMEAIRKGEYKVLIAPSDLVDFGGQKAFDLTHQLFIQQKGAFVLLLDGRKDLDEVLSEYKEYKDGNMTTKEILVHWVNSILTYCSPADDDMYPVIVFAATHRDELTEEEAKLKTEVLPRQLSEMFSTHDHSKRIKCDKVFFINATDSNDPGVLSLKTYLVDVAFQQKSWGDMMPMAWVPLELQIAELRSTNTFVISYDELKNLNINNDELFLEENQLKDFLRCQHSLGRLMYFDIQQLDQFIIVQPTAMVDILRSFVTDKMFWPIEPYLNRVLQNASETGIIKKMDLLKIWDQDDFNKYFPTSEIKEFIITVLIYLDILVPPKRFHQTTEELPDSFIVPCLINQHLPDEHLPFNLNGDNTIFLSYRLLKSTIPNALAYKLIGAVLNIWPLKRKDERCWLFDKTAVLEIDRDNELYLTFRENRMIVAMSNTKSKNFISPDISSIIQECLTLTMIKVLQFYFTAFGKSTTSLDVSNFFVIEVGQKCGEDLCFVSLSTIQDKSSWICKHHKEHNTKYLLYWIFKQNMCRQHCPGMDSKVMDMVPSDKHLIRLAKLIGREFNQFIIYLGLTPNQWHDIEDDRRFGNRLTQKFVGLCEWKTQKQAGCNPPTFRCLSKALTEIDYSEHFLCQIFMEKITEVFAMDNLNLKETPDESVLHELSCNIGHHTIHLGVELGLELIPIEETIFRCKDLFAQTYDILVKWKQSRKTQPTVRALMLALQHVDPRGFTFLTSHYGVSLPPPQDTEISVKLILQTESDVKSKELQYTKNPSVILDSRLVTCLQKAIGSIGIIKVNNSHGTCFRVGTDLILTAWHVVNQYIDDASNYAMRVEKGHHEEHSLQSITVTFSDNEGHHTCFEVECCVYHNEGLDTAILRLKHDDNSVFPPPFKQFFCLVPTENEHMEVSLIGHQTEQQQMNLKVKIWNPSTERMKSLNMFCYDNGYDKYVGYDELDKPNQIVLKCEFRHGASGCPGFVMLGDQLCVVTMFLRGFPVFYYARDFKSKQKDFPQEKLFQQGINITTIMEDLKKRAPILYKDIFQDGTDIWI